MKKLRLIFPVIIIALLFASCQKTLDRNLPSEKIEEIRAACSDPENEFPSKLVSVEFLEYSTPSSNDIRFSQTVRLANIADAPLKFSQTVRFANITDAPLKMSVLGFYNPALDEWIIARGGDIIGTEHETATIDTGTGWRFGNTLTLLYDWDEYTAEEQETMLELAKELYFEIQIDGQIYHVILDFSTETVIVNDYGVG